MSSTETPPVESPSRADGLDRLELQARAVELIDLERPTETVLADLCRQIEGAVPGAHAAIMLRTPDGVRLGAGPSLPVNVLAMLRSYPVNPVPGACREVLESGEPVLTGSIAREELWEDSAENFLSDGLNSCWSAPLSDEREGITVAIGTLDLYFRQERPPTHSDLELLETAAELTRLVLGRTRLIEELVRRTQFDSLTGLPNRELFGLRLRNLVRTQQDLSRDHRFAIVAVDVDQLKNINDTLGFNMGDYLLRAIGQRLGGCVRKEDTVARSSGDEFLMLIRDIHRDDDVAMLAEKIRTRINAPYEFDGQGLFVTATLGVSVYPWDGEDAQTLLRNAETALGHAKELGGGYQFFRPNMVRNKPTFEDWWQRSKLSSDLRYALERNELELFYQLKFDPAEQSILGSEALMRWSHPELGRLLPDRFIPMAEQTGLILSMGAWALEKACRQSKRWQDSGLRHMPVSVNVTAHQFRHGDLIRTVERVLEETGLEPHHLELEITESLAMEAGSGSLQRLQALHDLGVLLTIDDFGTGFSSLSYLSRFPIDTLKIDRSFILDIGTGNEKDHDSRSIVLAVLSIARSLDLRVVAEGVESEEQLDFLREHGCQEVQGFLLARPAAAEAVTERLIKRS